MNTNSLDQSYTKSDDLRYMTSALQCYTRRDRAIDPLHSDVLMVIYPNHTPSDKLRASVDDCLEDIKGQVIGGAKVVLARFLEFITSRNDDNMKVIDEYQFSARSTSTNILVQTCVKIKSMRIGVDLQFDLNTYKEGEEVRYTMETHLLMASAESEYDTHVKAELELTDALMLSMVKDPTLTDIQDACNIPRQKRVLPQEVDLICT